MLIFAACGNPTGEGPATITLMAHDSFADAVTEDTFAAFTAETGHQVELLAAGDAGAMVNQAILTKDNPLADVIFGIDDTFLTRALNAGILAPYSSALLDHVPDLLRPPSDLVTPIDYGDVCLNYDKEAFINTRPPSTLEDLVMPEYSGKLVVEDPSISSPGLAFLLSTIDRFGEQGWHQYWADLKANDVLVAPGWSEAYYGEFSGGAGEGNRPIVVSYASSPPAEVIFSERPLTEAPTAVITDGCYRQIEYVAELAGTNVSPAVQQLIDFMLSVEFQNTIPLTWFVFPANDNATLPQEFVEYTVVPENPVQMDPAAIEANRQRWLEEWAEVMG
jgi:thiamine transport system substrate-binding protein